MSKLKCESSFPWLLVHLIRSSDVASIKDLTIISLHLQWDPPECHSHIFFLHSCFFVFFFFGRTHFCHLWTLVVPSAGFCAIRECCQIWLLICLSMMQVCNLIAHCSGESITHNLGEFLGLFKSKIGSFLTNFKTQIRQRRIVQNSGIIFFFLNCLHFFGTHWIIFNDINWGVI